MTEQEIIETYGKSIWDMSAQELIDFDLDRKWVQLMGMEGETIEMPRKKGATK